MKEGEDSGHGEKETVLVEIARRWGRSRSGRIIVAVGSPFLFFGLACAAWRHRDFAAMILTFSLIWRGVKVGWLLLPFSADIRNRWAREMQIGGECQACQFRWLFFLAFLNLFQSMWEHGIRAVLDLDDLVVPCAFVVIGAVCHFKCRRFVRKAQSAV
jgi:hypothetical protein